MRPFFFLKCDNFHLPFIRMQTWGVKMNLSNENASLVVRGPRAASESIDPSLRSGWPYDVRLYRIGIRELKSD